MFIYPIDDIRAHGRVKQRWQGYQAPFAVGAGIVYCTKQAYKAHTNDPEKGQTRAYCKWC